MQVSLYLVFGVLTGALLAGGQYFMKLLSTSIPVGSGIHRLVYHVFLSPFTYTFVTVNVVASICYVVTLRGATMTQAFGMVYASMSIAVLVIDVAINKEVLSLQAIVGFVLALSGILLLGTQ